jgi:hypothetical protein
VHLSKAFEQDVDKFWEGLQINQQKKVIDGENFCSLMLYVLLKAKIP